MNSFGHIYLLAGKNAEAIPELEKAISLSGGSQRANAELGFAYTRLGKRTEALKLLNSLKERSKPRYVLPFEFALIYGGLGQRDRTLDYLRGPLKAVTLR